MKVISIILRDDQWPQLDLMHQETGLCKELIINSAINEYYNNYTAWKRRFSFARKEGGRENPIPDLALCALEQWR
jgi:hypothetical protein